MTIAFQQLTSVWALTLAAGAALAQPVQRQRPAPVEVAGRAVEATVSLVNDTTLRVSVSPLDAAGIPVALPEDPALVKRDWPAPALRVRTVTADQKISAGRFQVTVTPSPLRFRIERGGRAVQEISVDQATGSLRFSLGDGPLLGLGQGGEQFDRRNRKHLMRASHSGDRVVNGGRVPVPWLAGARWGIFLSRPLGDIDLTGGEGRIERAAGDIGPVLDAFVVSADAPAEVMKAYAELTGYPTMPPLWTLGFQQSHRTLLSREAVFEIARTLREKKLPCDALIYLDTVMPRHGWSTGRGQFDFDKTIFPNPRQDIRELQAMNFKVVLHKYFDPTRLFGTVKDPASPQREENEIPVYWDKHRPVAELGIDGWWPDSGEAADAGSRMARIRMYWEGPQIVRPNIRPYALHRTGYAGMQRYGGWLWSGDVYSNWDVFRRHIPMGLNVGMSGIPHWGTDIGGFYPTTGYTGELYVRWFQFAAFTPLFRSHGVMSYLHLPWGWNTGDLGPMEWSGRPEGSGLPDKSELRNARVEPICRKYSELRYRMLPYVYSLFREAHDTGMPVMRPLMMHYADDAQAAAREYEYLWGRDMLVAPVFEKGATSRTLYLPRGTWYDFWSGDTQDGGREVTRAVDLETMPLYVRAGAIVPMGPVKQYTAEKSDVPTELVVYPGANGAFTLYEDDGSTFDFEKGEFSKLRCEWNDASRQLTIQTEKGSQPIRKRFTVRLATAASGRTVDFDGKVLRFKL